MMTENERQALKQSQDFFNFDGDDGEELGGELEDALEPAPTQNGGLSYNNMVQRMDQLSLQGGGLPPAPLTVQTTVSHMVQPLNYPPVQQEFPHHPQQQQQQVVYHHQLPPQHQQQVMQSQPHLQPQFPLLPPSHFAGGPSGPMMGQAGPMVGPSGSHMGGPMGQPGPMGGPVPGQYQDPAIMSLSKLPPPAAQPHYMPGQPPQPQYLPPAQPQHFPAAPRPATFSPPTVPGMKTLADLEAEMMYGGPRPPVQQNQPGPSPMMVERGGHVGHINPALHNLNYPGMRDRQTSQHQQQVNHHKQQQMQQHQQFRHSPGLTNQQQLQQGLEQQLKHNQQRQNNNYNHGDGNRRRNDRENHNNQFYNDMSRDNQYYNDKREDGGHQRQRFRHNDPNRRNEETFGTAAVREAEFKEYGDQSVTRRELMPGHVHTLGILRHSRSRHDRHNHETFGEEEIAASHSTGDPLLDARMLEEEEEMAKRRKHYANSEDEYAGLMSQKDNQLKCDNPYVDDYYYTMYQARKEEAKNKDDNRAGNQLLLNESLVELQPSYTPAQFENSLGKLQCVTVKAPRQIIDVGVVRNDGDGSSPAPIHPVSDKKHAAGEYKLILMKIEVLYTALLDLESDKLKLNALPTGAPLREQISNDEVNHLQILQSGLSQTDIVSDCLSVAKGRSLVLRSLAYLSSVPDILNNILSSILANIHHVARNDQQDLQFWTLLAKYIDTESLEKLEPAASNLINLKTKVKKSVLSTSLGSSIMLTLILKASLETGKSNNNLSTWTLLAQSLLGSVAEGVKLGAFLAKFHLSESTLANLLNLDNKLKPAWINIMELSNGVEAESS